MQTTTLKTSSKQLLKGKIKKDRVEVLYSETITINTVNAEDQKEIIGTDKVVNFHTVLSRFLPHVDLLNAMKMLRKPVIQILEFGNFKGFEDYTIKGISLSGMEDGDDPRVVITASKKLEHQKKPFNFNTPAVTLANDDEYAGAEDLDKWVANICTEFFAFLFEGKHAESPQMKLQFADGSEEKMSVEEPD